MYFSGFIWIFKALTKSTDQVSFKRALDTIDVRLGSFPHAESESLRYWRGVIGKAHGDFEAGLLGCRVSSLTLLSMTVDGRTEGSEYPNLMLDSGREPYGL